MKHVLCETVTLLSLYCFGVEAFTHQRIYLYESGTLYLLSLYCFGVEAFTATNHMVFCEVTPGECFFPRLERRPIRRRPSERLDCSTHWWEPWKNASKPLDALRKASIQKQESNWNRSCDLVIVFTTDLWTQLFMDLQKGHTLNQSSWRFRNQLHSLNPYSWRNSEQTFMEALALQTRVHWDIPNLSSWNFVLSCPVWGGCWPTVEI